MAKFKYSFFNVILVYIRKRNCIHISSLIKALRRSSLCYNRREDIFEISDSFHYDDGPEELGTDTFQREPFVVLVKGIKTAGIFLLFQYKSCLTLIF